MSRIRADRVVNKTATDGPELTLGATLPTTGTISGPGGVNITGVVTATKFVGDGSGLVNLASQQQNTGVIVRNDGALVGTAVTINFGTNAYASPIVGGITTITTTNTDTNTSYDIAALPNGSNVILRLTGSDAVYDDINIIAGTNLTIDQVTTTGFRLNNSSIAGITSVFVDPTPRLGGTLDLNGKAILGASAVNITGNVQATEFIGNLTGDVTGDVSGDASGLTGTPDITVGAITASSANFSGNVNVAGVLSYEDVQNVDAVGLITARSGIKVISGGIEVTTGGIKVDDGISTIGGDGTTSGVNISDGAIQIKSNTGNPSYIDFYCEVSNSHKITLKAPPHADYSGNITFVLPGTNGSADGDLLATDGNGKTSWRTFATGKWSETSAGINTSSSVGIGTTNPKSQLQINEAGIQSMEGTWGASPGVSQTIDTIIIANEDYRIVEYSLYIQNPGATNTGETQVQKVLVTQDGTNAYYEEFAIMSNPNKLVSLSAEVAAGNLLLKATPETGVSGITTYKFIRTTLL
tara:strand:- start:2760 stop:4334 length:1575 start_codon:yes stop_codon:yes gene_type:complete